VLRAFREVSETPFLLLKDLFTLDEPKGQGLVWLQRCSATCADHSMLFCGFVSFEVTAGHPVIQSEGTHVALWNNTSKARSNIVRRHANLFHEFEREDVKPNPNPFLSGLSILMRCTH
jgi:hypothetical protein